MNLLDCLEDRRFVDAINKPIEFRVILNFCHADMSIASRISVSISELSISKKSKEIITGFSSSIVELHRNISGEVVALSTPKAITLPLGGWIVTYEKEIWFIRLLPPIQKLIMDVVNGKIPTIKEIYPDGMTTFNRISIGRLDLQRYLREEDK